jgi:pimeloyl-ACP methyl ester carboxylesterase
MAYLLSIAGSDRSILRFGRSPVFDLQLDGLSWADHIAARGWDVWLLDIRGFGRSTRPPEMNLPPEDAPPLATTAEAWRDFGAAVEFVLEHRGLRA